MFSRQYIPALFSAVLLSFGDVADSLVLGNRIGYIGLAALALTMPMSHVFNVIMNAFGIGGSVRFSSRMAQGKREEAVAGFQGVVLTALIVGVGIAAVGNLLLTPLLRLLGTVPGDGALFDAAKGYLRILLFGTPMLFLNYVLNYYLKTDDLEKQASTVFTAGNIVDIALNVVFVLILRMGVVGASLATVIGQTVGATGGVVLIIRHKGALRLTGWKPDFRDAWRSFRMGFSSSVEFLYSIVFLLVANNVLIRALGGVGVAIMDVILGVSYFMMNLYDAVAKSVLPVVSTYSGERNEAGMHHARNFGLLYTLITGGLLGAAVFLFPGAICRFFGMSDPDMLVKGQTALRFFAVSIPLSGVGILLINYYEAREMRWEALTRSTLRGVLPIVLALLFSLLLPERFWALYVIAEALTLVIAAVAYRFHPPKRLDSTRIYRATLYSTDDDVSRALAEIEAFCEKWEADPKQQYLAMLAVEEICIATMVNGFQEKTDGFIQIVMVAPEEGGFELHIRDNAASYNPLTLERKDDADDEDLSLGTLGVVAVKKTARSFSYRYFQGFNTVIIQI